LAASKWDKYITYNKVHPESEWRKPFADKLPPRDPNRGRILTWVDNDAIKGGFYYESFMALKPTPTGYFNDPPHTHDWDEIIGIFSTNPNDSDNLGGEIQLNMGDDDLRFTKSCCIFVPRGTRHGPMIMRKVTTPIILVTTGNSPYYTQSLTPGWENKLGKY
jgi:hypothetical protein